MTNPPPHVSLKLPVWEWSYTYAPHLWWRGAWVWVHHQSQRTILRLRDSQRVIDGQQVEGSVSAMALTLRYWNWALYVRVGPWVWWVWHFREREPR